VSLDSFILLISYKCNVLAFWHGSLIRVISNFPAETTFPIEITCVSGLINIRGDDTDMLVTRFSVEQGT